MLRGLAIGLLCLLATGAKAEEMISAGQWLFKGREYREQYLLGYVVGFNSIATEEQTEWLLKCTGLDIEKIDSIVLRFGVHWIARSKETFPQFTPVLVNTALDTTCGKRPR